MNIKIKFKNVISLISYIYIISLLTMANHDQYFIINRISFVFLFLMFITISIKRRIKIDQSILIFLPFVFIVILSNLWAVDRAVSVHRTVGIITYFLGALIIYIFLKGKFVSKKALMSSLFISLWILSITASYEYYFLGFSRGAGVVQNANTFGLNVIYISLILLFTINKSSKLYKWKIFLLIIFIINSVIVSGSRKIFISVFLMLLQYVLMETLVDKKRLKVIFYLIFFILIVILVLSTDIFHDMFKNIEAFNRLLSRDDNSYNIRTEMINSSISLSKERPFFGYGIDNFRSISVFGTYSHNNYTELLVSVGIIGMSLYYLIYLYVIRINYHIFVKTRNIKVFSFFVLFIVILLVQEVALVTINSPRNWLVLFLLLWMTQDFQKRYQPFDYNLLQ
ncbi:O-antigen ligase family protein [Alkalibacterium kapii]|uniref:O-antigen ligase-related domain-containing protein n=1 Tax=Alkalibacterium kapii TaxID=426704 RepID=A0A511AS61_9LACT|nr:hypothetical protein AKA01nite_06570 [Alkalibacterium kapii]